MRQLITYVGTVRGLRSHLAAQLYPGKVISLDAHRQRKTTSAKVASHKVSCKVVSFILPDGVA